MGRKATIVFWVCAAVSVTTICYDLMLKGTRSPVQVTVNPPPAEKPSSEAVSVESHTKSNKKPTAPSSETTAVTETTMADVDDELFVDLNTADAEELMKLKGIGEHLAAEIISYREEHGRFDNVEEIMKVSGIGEGIFYDICGYIYVVDPYYPSEIIEAPREIDVFHEPTLDDVAPININDADADILRLLPHVDDEVAEKIVELRERLGGFSNVRELLLVEELSRDEVIDIIDYITID